MNRRIVPDTSVIVAGHFQEKHSKAADKLVAAIERQSVTAFAPHVLIAEFLKVAASKCSTRTGSQFVDPEDADAQVRLFFNMRLTYIRESQIKELAWDLIRNEAIPPPDSWMLACAIHVDGELWLSHEQRDGFASVARRLRPNNVFTLDHDSKRLP